MADEPKEAQMIIELISKRSGDRPGWDELEWLQAKGYKPCLNRFDARWAETTSCSRWGHHWMG
jgi:hypothetical protein